MTEQIGKIMLDFSRYSGEDLYCDGAVEDELLDIVQRYGQVEYPKLIEQRGSWPILYHLSPLRENIVDYVPMTKRDRVLEVGSGCGAITGVLSRKAGSVTCVDLSRKRSMINAYRHSDCDNVTIHVGNFRDIEPQLPQDYDYICLIGVFEYGRGYIGGAHPYED
ncbi:MAG: class I SAM-dependent methyltransferase, partial [Acetatifactor sp.]|nr:class I SAM-dependent methyltransferase [Acetatifactor sp.]